MQRRTEPVIERKPPQQFICEICDEPADSEACEDCRRSCSPVCAIATPEQLETWDEVLP